MSAVALTTTFVVAPGCGGGGGGSSIDDLARGLRSAATRTKGEEADSTALNVTCTALKVFSSEGAQSLTESLRAQANAQRVLSGQTLSQYDPRAPQLLIEAADEINTVQKATDVATKLGCR